MHSQEPRASKSCSIRALIRAPKRCSIRVPDSDPEKSYTIRAPKRWLVDTNVHIETVASKEPLEKHAQPRVRASKSCSIRALIRAPKRCSIRVPDSGPEKSYTIRAPKEWLVDTIVQIETVASKEPLKKHSQPRAPGTEKLFDSGPDSAPEKLFHSGPGFGPRKVRAPIRAPKSRIPFGSRIRAPKSCSIWAPGSSSKLFSSWKNYSCWLRRLVQNLGRVQAPKLPQREQGTVAQWQRARTNLRTRSWIQIPLAPIFCAE